MDVIIVTFFIVIPLIAVILLVKDLISSKKGHNMKNSIPNSFRKNMMSNEEVIAVTKWLSK